jgi:outer membrane protein OmpA-like peptidoglycan-associated protein
LRLTPFAKLFISLVIVVVVGVVVYHYGLLERLAPQAQHQASGVPPAANIPGDTGASTGSTGSSTGSSSAIPNVPAIPKEAAGCADLPEVRIFGYAWNAQAGVLYATGGKQATRESLMCKHGVNLKFERKDSNDDLAALLVTFAESVKKGEKNPSAGAHFVMLMGDGSPTFFAGLNDRLSKLGPDYVAQVVAVTGYSRGEDKFMGPQQWRQNPQTARGGLVAGVLRDGDWNIAMKWLADNNIPNNPDEKTYDPDALNWINANDYVEAAQKYVSNYCETLKHKTTGVPLKMCVNGVVTWTPGDVTVAEGRGGIVSIVSTREYRNQMPCVVIGIKRWMQDNRKAVESMIAAMLEGGEAVKSSDEALKKASAVAAIDYGEKEPGYWYKFFHVVQMEDKQGIPVELGGSSVNNLADDLQTFGLAPGSQNLFAATYTVFGNIQHHEYPSLVPSFPKWESVTDLSFLKAVAQAAGGKTGSADLPVFKKDDSLKQLVSRRSWKINFETGSARFTPETSATLDELTRQLEIAGGTLVEIHGHTDNVGTAETNQQLSEQRAFAVKSYLEGKSPANFPQGRVKVFAHGMNQPVVPNTSAANRAKNRRVEIVLGT